MTSTSHHSSHRKTEKSKPLIRSVAIVVGFILSPLSWWNDMFVNIPLAYAFSYPFSLIDQDFYLPAFIIAYWFSNLIGFLLLHYGVAGIAKQSVRKIGIRGHIIVTSLYTTLIIILVLLEWLPVPTEILSKFN